jgi:CBS domain-containing protein
VKIREIFRPDALSISPAATLREAAAAMRTRAVSCLPVLLHGRVVGMLTERDIFGAVARGAHPSVARTGDYMNDESGALAVDDESNVAVEKMLAFGCRHLPVTEMGSLLGMVSFLDIYLVSTPTDAERLLLGLSDRR